MTLIAAIAVFMLSLLLTGIFVFGLKTKGPWGSTWSFLLVIVLTLSTVSVWVPPAAPLWFSVPWIDLTISGLFVSFILTALTPTPGDYRRSMLNSNIVNEEGLENVERAGSEVRQRQNKQRRIFSAGSFFWMLLLVLCVLILIGAA